jgi:hypothetical protein
MGGFLSGGERSCKAGGRGVKGWSARAVEGREERTSFLKKKKQKTFVYLASASPGKLSPDTQKFFGSFFQKRTAFYHLPLLFGSALNHE